jgi:regulatory protein YycH of two-component signal transduction system YycFG
MMEKIKSVLLTLLVVFSLVQSYFLAYSMPSMEAKVNTELDYVKAELLGEEEKTKNLVFPEQLVIHLGEDKHTVFFPNTLPYYKLIFEKLQGRAFQGMQSYSINSIDWDQIRRENKGVELRFGRAIPFELLQQVFQIDGDFLPSRDSIERIWIYSSTDSEEVQTFFFSADGVNVYESLRADLTIGDVEGYVSYGQYWDPYTSVDGELYVPDEPITRLVKMEVPFIRYTTEQMQDNLFFDPRSTRTIQDIKDGPKFYTDGNRGLKIEQNGTWMTYTDTMAPTNGEDNMIDNIMAATSFVNQHGGWNGKHQWVQGLSSEEENIIRFQQYYRDVPIVSDTTMNLGYMQMTLQQGFVSSYNRSLLILGDEVKNKSTRKLPGGSELRQTINDLVQAGRNIEALFPAYRPTMGEESIILNPVWAARLMSGEVIVVADASPL